MPDNPEHCFAYPKCLSRVHHLQLPYCSHYQNKLLVPLEKLANVVSLSVVIAEVLVAIPDELDVMLAEFVDMFVVFVVMLVVFEPIFEVLFDIFVIACYV